MSRLQVLLQRQNYDDAVAEFERIRADLPAFEAPDTYYNRHLLSIENGHWLSVLNWSAGVKSPVHGHPDAAFVYVVSGEVRCINYAENPLRQTQIQTYQTGDAFYSIGKRGQFNNAIHQLCTDVPAQTLHFYSDDVDKGYTYQFNRH